MTENLKEVSFTQKEIVKDKESDKSRFLIYGPKEDPKEVLKENYLSELFETKLFNPSTNVQDKAFKDSIGEPHPFDYELVEQVAMKFGLIPAIIDKISDYTLGPGINVYSDEEKEKKILDNFIKITKLKTHLRPWFKEGLLKGMGYFECAGLNDIKAQEAIKCVSADTIYIKRNEEGEVELINQYFGNLNKKASIGNTKEVNEIDKDNIIPIEINKFGNSVYGMGIVYGGLPMVNDFLNSQSSVHKLMNRKANNPIHVKVGNVATGDIPEQSEIDAIGQKLQYMNHSTEYVTGPNVEMNVLNFGDVMGKFEGILKNDLKLLSYHFQVPESVLGSDRGYAGASEMQDSGFMRQIKSYQEQIAEILSSKLFDKILLKHGITEPKYYITWGQESEQEKNAVRTTYIQLLSGSINLSPAMRKAYEKKLAELDEIDYSVVEDENEREEKENPIQQPQMKPAEFPFKKPEEGDKEKEEPSEEPEQEEKPKSEENITEIIRKVGDKWIVFDHRTKKRLGEFDTKDEAEKRLQQIQFFKNKENIHQYIQDLILQGDAVQEIEADIIKEFNIEEIEAYRYVNEEWNELFKDEKIEEVIGKFGSIKPYVIDFIKKDEFKNLKANNDEDINLGLLSETQINKLKEIFINAFEKDIGVKKLVENIAKLDLKDRFYKKEGKLVLSITKENRPYVIGKTELVRIRANASLLKFKDMGAKEVFFTTGIKEEKKVSENINERNVKPLIFVTQNDDKVCPLCNALEGKQFNVEEAVDTIPLHSNCFIYHKTPIYTSQGYKDIGNIKIGDLVLTHKGKFNKVSKLSDPKLKYTGDIVDIKFNYKKCKKFKTGMHRKISVTPNHPILTDNGWKPAGNICKHDKIFVMSRKCKECNKEYPILDNYDREKGFCSISCGSKYTAKEQYKDEWQHEIRSTKAKEQMKREDRKNKWSKEKLQKLTENARTNGIITIKNLIKEGKHPFQIKRWDQLSDDNLKKKEIIKKLKDRNGIKNPRHKSKFDEEYWKEDSEKRKKYYQENPDKHPNRIMAKKMKETHSHYRSKHQLKLYNIIKEKYKDAELEYYIRANNKNRFLDIAIPSLKMDIEYDGELNHTSIEDKEKDKIRDEDLKNIGWITLRFTKDNINNVIDEIQRLEKNHNGEYQFIAINPSNVNRHRVKNRKIYNFSVEENESYIANNIVTHNCRCGWGIWS